MSYRAIITPRDYRDIDEAAACYENEATTLGEKLKADVADTMRAIAERPFFFPETDSPFRGARCKKFPYKVYYAVLNDEVVILAVYHLKRDPKRWNALDR